MPPSFTWLKDPAVIAIMTALRAGGEARVVGGAVRDALLGKVASEIDFAATMPPEQTSALLAKANIKTVPTGIDHGTLTAVVSGKGYEITTLRQDVETDGRHAKVEFTDDWQADAARRDFTFNALYVDAGGAIYDYFKGREDLAAGRVRFIGDARARISEDVLRILRFFRFHAWFGKNDLDAEGLAACRELAHLMPQLSVERVWRELTKLLAASNPLSVWHAMLDAKILAALLPDARDAARLEGLLQIEKKYGVAPSALRRFAALQPPDVAEAAALAAKLKLSKREAVRLRALLTVPVTLEGKLDPVPFRRALYAHGVDDAVDSALLFAATHPDTDLQGALDVAAAWESPVFPLQGQDLLALGMKAGPEMGTLLKTVEQQWCDADFRPAHAECIALAKAHIAH